MERDTGTQHILHFDYPFNDNKMHLHLYKYVHRVLFFLKKTTNHNKKLPKINREK